VDGLKQLGYQPRLHDLTPIIEGRAVQPATPPWELGPGTAIFHLSPQHLPIGLKAVGYPYLAGKRIIGYWAWELPHVPRFWLDAARLVDEIWVPSHFVARAVRERIDKPVQVVPHPVACGPTGQRARPRFGIPEDRFVVLSVFHVRSCVERKNPQALLGAFIAAFGSDPSSMLMFKITGGSSAPAAMREFRRQASKYPNVVLLEEELSRQDMLDLIASVDVLASLHRAEGFGLAPAQAMLCGTAVMATAWSGNLDFMDDRTSILIPCVETSVVDPQGCYNSQDGQMWANPSEADATASLTFLRQHPQERNERVELARLQAKRLLGADAYAKALASMLPAPHGDQHRSLLAD
jgi:glycosyltransferase involved in cell wall biosynthesis